MNRFVHPAISLLFILSIVSGIAHAEQLASTTADVTAPELEQKNLVTKIAAGKDHQILVTATDNVAIKDVVLFYRDIGDSMYRNKVMRNIPNTDEYSVTLSASEIHGDGLEYYIKATDHAGNTLLLGYAFSPIAIHVEHPALTEQVASASTTDTSKSEKKYESETSYKWLWIGLGVLAIGAIAAASGGGDDGGGSGGVISSGPSGDPTVVINAPVP